MRRLIVNADDFGLHPGMNAGILRCHREGIVTSASICPSGSAFTEAVSAARSAAALSVGVHLTLVDERPLSPPESIPTLAPAGRLPGYFTVLFRRLFLRQVREEEIEREITAQVACAVDTGLHISHLDSHQHVHLHPAILPIVVRVAQRFQIGAIRAASRVFPLRGLRPALLLLFAMRGARQVRRAGLRAADTFLGMAETGRLDEARLVNLLARIPDGVSELVCHPGLGTATIAAAYPWGFEWDVETDALTSPRVRDALAQRDVTLMSYRQL